MTVATGVVADALDASTFLAIVDVSAHHRRSTITQCPKCLPVPSRHLMASDELVAELPDDLSYLVVGSFKKPVHDKGNRVGREYRVG